MALLKGGKLYGSISIYSLSKKLQYHEVRLGDILYSLHTKKDGEWLMQIMRVWDFQGKKGMSLQGMEYDVSNKDPFFVPEFKPVVKDVVYPDVDDDDVPF